MVLHRRPASLTVLALCLSTPFSAVGQPLPARALGRLGPAPLVNRSVGSVGYPPLALSADGKRIASVGDGVKVWDLETGKLLFEAKGIGGEFDLSPDGSLLAVSYNLYDVASGKQLRNVPGGRPRFAPDGKTLVTTSLDYQSSLNTVQLVDVNSGKVLRSCGSYPSKPSWFSFAPDGTRLAGVGEDGIVYLWDVATGKELRRCTGHRAKAESVAFAPDGSQLLSAGRDGTVRVWDAATGKELARYHSGTEGTLHHERCQAAFSRDGKRLFVIWDGTGRGDILDWQSGRSLGALPGYRDQYGVRGHTLSGEAEMLAACCATDGIIHVWDLTTGRERTTAYPRPPISALAVTSDGRTVSLCEAEEQVGLWDVASGTRRFLLPTNRTMVQTLALTPNGTRLATGNVLDTAVSLWDVATGKEVRVLHGHARRVDRVWYSANGKSLFALDGAAQLHHWDEAAGKEVAQFSLSTGYPIGVSDDARRALLSSYDLNRRVREARLVDVVTGKTVSQLPAELLDRSPQLAPDGRWAATEGDQGKPMMRLWSTAPGRLLHTVDLSLNEPAAAPVSFSRSASRPLFRFTPDGQSIVAINGTRAARVWETRTGLERLRLEGHSGVIRGTALSPDGRVMATAGVDGDVLVWDLWEQWAPAARAPTPPELDAHWSALADLDAVKAFTSLCAMRRAPVAGVAYVKERLKPVPVVSPEQVGRLIADLDAKDQTTRQQAADTLENIGEPAEAALRKALESKPAPDTQGRIAKLLDRLGGSQTGPELLRALRAVEVLENIATPDAQQTLQVLARGAAGARLTIEAQVALARLAQSGGPSRER